jgi:hypothetical protein
MDEIDRTHRQSDGAVKTESVTACARVNDPRLSLSPEIERE